MQAQKRHQIIRVRILRVAAQHVDHFAQRMALRECPPDGIVQGKVEQGLDPGVYAIKARPAALEERRHSHIAIVDFADRFQVRKLPAQGRCSTAA